MFGVESEQKIARIRLSFLCPELSFMVPRKLLGKDDPPEKKQASPVA